MASNEGTVARFMWSQLDADGDPQPPIDLGLAGVAPEVTLATRPRFNQPRTQQLAGVNHPVLTVLGSGMAVQIAAAVYTDTLAAIETGPGILFYAQPESQHAAAVPLEIIDSPEGEAPVTVSAAEVTVVNLTLLQCDEPTSGFGYADLPAASGDAVTMAAADGATLWTLCPAQTASTVMIAGASLAVPAAGVADRRTINADTAVYGAARGMSILVK